MRKKCHPRHKGRKNIVTCLITTTYNIKTKVGTPPALLLPNTNNVVHLVQLLLTSEQL